MKAVIRKPLTAGQQTYLRRQQQEVDGLPTQAERADRAQALWPTRTRSQNFRDIRAILLEMCHSLGRCMYCEDSRATDIEHIRPKEHYPEVAFVWENYAYACNVCNQQYKSDRYCEGFLDPTVAGFDVWEHWRFDPATGALIARPGTPAEETLRILGFKHDARKPERTDLTIRRRDFYGLVVHLVRSYGVARRTGDVAETKQVVDQLRSPLQFASIVEWALRNRQPAENDRSVRLVLDAYPELPDLVLTG